MTRIVPERLAALILTAIAALLALSGFGLAILPAQAQFFDDRFQWFDFRGPQYRMPRQVEPRGSPPDFSKAPAPTRKPEADPQTTVVVFGDSMADWLAYGLESTFAESPEIAVMRKHSANSGLVRSETRADHPDWPQQARDVLNAEKAGIAVMMIGLHDRQSIRERVTVRAPAPQGQQPRAAAPGAQPVSAGQSAQTPTAAAQPQAPAAPAGPEQQAQAEEGQPEPPPPSAAPVAPAAPAVPEPRTGTTVRTHEFRSEKWAELYVQRVDDTIAAMKAKGVPVIWVGLPSIRGARSTADAQYLNEIYRSRAERAGIVYVDLWDAFTDDAGRFAVQGPDFEGQIRRLRSADGVHFTRAGARTMAHFVEREIRRALAARAMPVAIPVPQEPTPQIPDTRPGAAVARPLSGPVMPLSATPPAADDLLAGGGMSRAITDPIATRVLVKGDPVPAPAGRADDFAWPRRTVAPVGTDPVATTTTAPAVPVVTQPARPSATAPVAATSPAAAPADAPSRPSSASRQTSGQSQAAAPRPPGSMPRARRPQTAPPGFSSPFFRW